MVLKTKIKEFKHLILPY